MTEAEKDKIEDVREHQKVFHDYLKHLTTLSTGSIVLLAAFLEKLFIQRMWKVLVALSFVAFILSVIAAVAAHTFFVLHFPRPENKPTEWIKDATAFALLIAWLGFLIGVVSLAIFSIRNLYV